MEFLHRAVPHRIRRLVSRAKGKEMGTGTEDSYRLRRMESHVSMAATKRRRIYLNLTPESVDHDNAASSHDSLPHYPTNKIRTSRYDLFSFIPKNLFEQFRRIANLYFLFVAGLSIVPILGGFPPFLTFLPLIFIISVTAFKDAIEDWRRRKSDRAFNKSPTILLRNWTNTNVHHSRVGPTRIHGTWTKFRGWLKQSLSRKDPNNRDPAPFTLPRHRAFQTGSGASALSGVSAAMSTATAGAVSDHGSSLNERNVEGDSALGPGALDRIGRQSSSDTGAPRPHAAMRRKVPHSVLNHAESYSGRSMSGKSAMWKECKWQDVKVGDIVYLRNDDPIPADIVILSTSEADGLCFIETKNLDGETNLKIRRALTATSGIKTPADIERAAFYVDSEAPHANLYSYQGALKWLISDGTDMPAGDRVVHNKTESITINEVLLRGCVLRNTDHVIGMVLFTGADSKIMLNSGNTPSKRSRIEKDLNFHIVMNFIILFALSIGSAIANGVIFADVNNNSGSWFEYGGDASTPFMSAFITFWSCLILYQNIIPISLYISIEIVKTAQAYFIHKDIDMYDERVNQACTPKTWSISDDLGQIEYIFSDKTGTLTQNVMEFKKCTINGIDYGIGETDATRGQQRMTGDGEFEAMEFQSDEQYQIKLEEERQKMKAAMGRLFDNKYYSDKTTFIDADLFTDMADPTSKHAKAIMNFWTALAVCHTVISERNVEQDPYRIEYKSQSPDESALVATARDVGFVFLEKIGAMMHLEIMGQPRSYKILNILEFNSNRKRMSIILRPPEGGIVLVCKGADSVIYERLDKNEEQLKLREDTLVDLERFANEGLRTLCLAYRKISEEEYENWVVEYDAAASSIHNRDENIENACESIEHSLILLGGTAIEDRLQEGVPECIALLSRAGIKLWVLTGDKTETAINIGFACNLLQRDMILIIIQAHDKEDTREQLMKALEKFWGYEATKDPGLANRSHALIIDGETLKYGLSPALNGLLLDVGKRCKSVICCRVSPLQKAKVVSMVKRGLDVMTLSIGDGANDVSMIQEANIGVGIAGEEGRQAVMASDFAIAQFRFLSKLLLVHGRWSYIRISEMVLTFFYKNIVWAFTIFWFQFYCGFTALLMYDYTFVVLYNLVFTSLPNMFMGAFDQDVDAKTSLQFPALYRRGILQKHFTRAQFWLYVLDALYQSVVCFYIPYFLTSDDVFPSGRSSNDLQAFGMTIGACIVVVANLYVGLNMFHWTKMIFVVIFGSILVFFLYCVVYANLFTIDNAFYGMDSILLNSPSFWLAIVLSVVITMLPHYAYKVARHYFKPNDIIIVREQLYKEKHPSKKERRARKLKQMALNEALSKGETGLTSSSSGILDSDEGDIHSETSAHGVEGQMEEYDVEEEYPDNDQVPRLRFEKYALSSEEDLSSQATAGGEMEQPSRSSSSFAGMKDADTSAPSAKQALLDTSKPTRELVGRRRIAANSNHGGSGDQGVGTDNTEENEDIVSELDGVGTSRAGTETSSATLTPTTFPQGYPTTSFSFNQEYMSPAGAANGGSSAKRASEGAAKARPPNSSERPRPKRQSSPAVPVGGPNFLFMGDPDNFGSSSGFGASSSGSGTGGLKLPGHTGFAFSTDDASAFVYSHLHRLKSASHEDRTARSGESQDVGNPVGRSTAIEPLSSSGSISARHGAGFGAMDATSGRTGTLRSKRSSMYRGARNNSVDGSERGSMLFSMLAPASSSAFVASTVTPLSQPLFDSSAMSSRVEPLAGSGHESGSTSESASTLESLEQKTRGSGWTNRPGADAGTEPLLASSPTSISPPSLSPTLPASSTPTSPFSKATSAMPSSSSSSSITRPRGLSRSITSPDVPVAELGAMLLQHQQELEQGLERMSKAQESVRALAAMRRVSLQKVRFQDQRQEHSPVLNQSQTENQSQGQSQIQDHDNTQDQPKDQPQD